MAYVVERAVDIVIRAFRQRLNVSDHRGQASSGCKGSMTASVQHLICRPGRLAE
jgi:hypothetical protein